MTTTLNITQLRFDCTATTPLKLSEHKAGHYLRGAIGNVMLQSTCPETRRREKLTPEHAAVCPVCWLLAAEVDPGDVRRAYSLTPPLPALDLVQPGASFSFTLTLYGRGLEYLPYFVLAIPAVGRTGLGPGRGKFELDSIWALNPLTEEEKPVLLPGENIVHMPEATLTWDQVQPTLHRWLPALDADPRLDIRFLTPTRLIYDDALVKTPDFGVFFRRLLERIDHLEQQHAHGQPRPPGEIQALYQQADQVRLVDSDVTWIDYFGSSRRSHRRTPLSGFVGSATYRSGDWASLLPWLILGQGTQVGKHTVRGNGSFKIYPKEV